ncbi:MAG: Asp-tRNA(Asn)/Glu-tRNA(Gln) amidotransferase subunit GatA [Patescibacteria group bacterium]
MKLNELTIKEARILLDKKEITSVDITKACLDRIKEVDRKINAFLTVCEKEALTQAKKADERIAQGEKGKLLGIPFGVKDVIMTKGVRTTAASKILENYIAPYDSTVVKKLKEAGAVMLGKLNCDEFAHGASGENSAYGPTKNPWDFSRVAGGSSSGPGASVAADMCLFSVGTDTGGSIRCPASFCNVVGLKPTYGRNSRFGLIAMTSSTDCPGPMAKTVEDAAIIERVLAGRDKNDATTPDEKVPDYTNELKKNIKGLKIGIPEEFIKEADEGVLKVFKESAKVLNNLGAHTIDIRLPYAKYGVPAYYIITPSEVSSNLARFDGIRFGFSQKQTKDLKEIYFKSKGKGFGPEAKRRIMLGTYALSAGYYDAYYLKAQKVRTIIKNELDSELKKVDIILTPSQPDVAFKIGEKVNDPIKMYLEDLFAIPVSLAGLPAISIPAGFSQKMPVGLQLIGRRFNEGMLFRIGHHFQKNTNYHLNKPKI